MALLTSGFSTVIKIIVFVTGKILFVNKQSLCLVFLRFTH